MKTKEKSHPTNKDKEQYTAPTMIYETNGSRQIALFSFVNRSKIYMCIAKITIFGEYS